MIYGSAVQAFTSLILKHVWLSRPGILHSPHACRWYPCCKISDHTFKEQDLRISVPTVERRASKEPDSLAPATENSCFTDRFYKGPQWQRPSTVLGRWRCMYGLDLMSYLTQRQQILGAESRIAWRLCVPLCEEGQRASLLD